MYGEHRARDSSACSCPAENPPLLSTARQQWVPGLSWAFSAAPRPLEFTFRGCQDKRGQARLLGQHGGLGRPQELPGQVGCLHTFLPPCCLPRLPAAASSPWGFGIWGVGATQKRREELPVRGCRHGEGGRGAGCGDQAVRGSHKQLKKKP